MLEPNALTYAVSLLVALGISLIMTPVVRRLSRRIGFVDRPDGGRKTHTTAVALGGGLAVFFSTVVAIVVGLSVAAALGLEPWSLRDAPIMLGLIVASMLIVALGLVDDAIGMRGRYKLLGQVLIAGMLVWLGLRIEMFTLFGIPVTLGWLGIPFTMFWLLGTINAVNLIDGIDGLASSVGVVLCLTVATINCIQGHFTETVVMLALAGALLGFLRYNFAPASIYLGDTGSMLVGMVVGAIAVHTSVKESAAIAMAVPVAVWSIPILDSLAAILRRKLTGRSVFAADRGHLHHSLLVRGWSVRQAALFIATICAATCLSAVVSFVMGNEIYAVLTVLGVVVFLIFTRTFGHIEFALVRDQFRHTALSSLGSSSNETSRHRESSFQLQGSREWDKLWSAIIESAEEYRLMKFKLSINMPSLHESFFASWQSSDLTKADAERLWKVTLPLVLDGKTVGLAEMSGMPVDADGSTVNHMLQALDFLEPIEDDIRQIREQIRLDNDTLMLRRTAKVRVDPPESIPTGVDISTPVI